MSVTRRTRASIMLAALVLGVAACAQAGLDKAGDVVSKPLVLTLANDSSDPATVQPFATAVQQLSHGAVQIRIVGPSARLKDENYEAPLVKDVQTGVVPLGFTGTQAFDPLGVSAFQALQAPFLIDSYPLERKVMSGEVAQRMLAGLKPMGLVGLGLIPGPFARPFGFARPLLGTSAYRGVKIGTLVALVDEDTFRALGAVPDSQASVTGDISGLAGVETDVETADIWNSGRRASLTGNVILFPWPGIYFMNRRAFDSLTAAQRSILIRAAAQLIREPVWFGNDTVYGRDLCRQNKIATASPADLAGLQMAVQPVYRMLRANPSVRASIAQITSLRHAMGVPPDSISCASARNAPQSTTTTKQLNGMWQVTYTEQEFVRAGAAEPEIYVQPGNWGHYSLKLSNDRWWLRLIGGDPGVAPNQLYGSGTYTVTGDKILFRRLNGSSLGSDAAFWGPYIWSVYRDALTFKKAGTTPMPTDLIVKPWIRTT